MADEVFPGDFLAMDSDGIFQLSPAVATVQNNVTYEGGLRIGTFIGASVAANAADSNRWDRTGTIYTFEETEDAAGFLVQSETSLITSWKFMTFRKPTQQEQLVKEQYAQEPNAKIIFISGRYDSRIQKNQVIVDDDSGARYLILGQQGQRGFNVTNQHHIAITCVEQQRTAAEA